ncbi:MAG: radical SAM protein [Nitrospira sp.]|nr:radical SAM protein [bacterium]MBL7048034.1 radical SAM protein [Nitrospira sp.]
MIDGHKLLWHLDRVSQWQEKKVVAPVYVEISPLSVCNHKCIFCGIDFARDKGDRLERDVLVESLKAMGAAGVRSVMFAGEGEPLLHNDLPEFIKVARSSGMDVSVTSNGTLGTYELWKDILPHLTWIRFSVDAGTAAVHSRVHNVQESVFGKTIKSIQEAVRVKEELGLEVTLGVQYLIIEENINDIENALRLFSEIGVDYLSLKPYSLHPQMIDKKETVYTDEVIGEIDSVVEHYRSKTGMNIVFRKEALTKYMEKSRVFDHCCALPFWGYISSKGDFYTCSVFIGDERFKTGNIYKDDMNEILFGERRACSLKFGESELVLKNECRLNCRMARINEFLHTVNNKPEHVNFI